MSKDFLDEKNTDKEQSASKSQFQQWSSYSSPKAEQAKSHKPLYISLICIAMALCIVLGWTLGTVLTGSPSDKGESILREVLSVLDNKFYKDIPEEQLWEAIEAAGTALFQTAGDRYSRLMSPKTFYEYTHPSSNVSGDGGNGMFGVSFQVVEGIGMYVGSVVVNSNAYGVLDEGDIVVKISNINDGAGIVFNGETRSEIVLNNLNSEAISQALSSINSADFHVLRNGDVVTKYLTRGAINYPNINYPYEFVEFYFGDDLTNVSTKNIGSAQSNTKDERLLANLSRLKDTGYVRLVEFGQTTAAYGITSVADEFRSVMELFKQRGLKRLILDLKGNPGGDVELVCDIAGMLVTDAKLTAEEKKIVIDSNDRLLITTLDFRTMGKRKFARASSYSDYFGSVGDKCDIVVWTDGGSASASELLTGALRDYKTAVQMGVTTYGKGIAQRVEQLANYTADIVVDGELVTSCWAVYYTAAEYFSPVAGDNIHGVGYTPETQYDNLDTYDKLWQATISYFGASSGGIQV